jgi:hypothetical protein
MFITLLKRVSCSSHGKDFLYAPFVRETVRYYLGFGLFEALSVDDILEVD